MSIRNKRIFLRKKRKIDHFLHLPQAVQAAQVIPAIPARITNKFGVNSLKRLQGIILLIQNIDNETGRRSTSPMLIRFSDRTSSVPEWVVWRNRRTCVVSRSWWRGEMRKSTTTITTTELRVICFNKLMKLIIKIKCHYAEGEVCLVSMQSYSSIIWGLLSFCLERKEAKFNLWYWLRIDFMLFDFYGR